MELLRPDQRSTVQAFVASRSLPEKLGHAFIAALRDALSGLTKVSVTTTELRAALVSAGSPATIDDLKDRFAAYVDQQARGHDPAKVRIILEE